MRYSAEHKDETRERILRSAASQFRSDGTTGVSVADVMEAAGMTHGGFYKHFKGKEQLLSSAIEVALSDMSANIERMTTGLSRQDALTAVIDFYLSDEHVRHPELGCALAALGTEMARLPRRVKSQVSRALDSYASRLDFLMPGANEEERRSAFLVLFPSMAGCIMTARAYADGNRRGQILSGARAFFIRAFSGDASMLVTGARK